MSIMIISYNDVRMIETYSKDLVDSEIYVTESTYEVIRSKSNLDLIIGLSQKFGDNIIVRNMGVPKDGTDFWTRDEFEKQPDLSTSGLDTITMGGNNNVRLDRTNK